MSFTNILVLFTPTYKKFTNKLAQNNQLAFLDVWINNQDGKLTLKTYRKPTHTGLHIKWQSLVPLKYKINLVRNLLHRAYKTCSSYSLIHEDFKMISTMLEKNGCPSQDLLWYMKHQELAKDSDTRTDKQQYIAQRLYINSIALADNLTLDRPKETLKLESMNHKPQNSTNNETDVSQHLKYNPDHTINFHSPEILAHSNNIRKLRIKETLLIQNLQPQLNIDDCSNPIHLFNIWFSSSCSRNIRVQA